MVVSNLDVVGDPETSRANAAYMRSHGLKPIEVYHVQSPWEELERLLQEDHPVIGIGGSVGLSEEERARIFTELFSRYPGNYHFLGGSSKCLCRFPWFSADSRSWCFCGRMGELITPNGHIPAPDKWSAEECIAFNSMHLRELEENYDGVHQMPMLIPPFLPQQQLTLF